MLALLFLTAVPLTLPDIAADLRFEWSPSRDPRQTSVEAGPLADGVNGTRDYWFRRVVYTHRARSEWWTDTIRCPSAREVLLQATRLTPPKAMIYGVGADEPENVIVTADGAEYSIEIEATYRGQLGHKLRFTASDGTPLAEWVGTSLRTLDLCWSKDRPTIPIP